MANLNKINKEYNEILSGLSYEEIVAYYRNINKKMLETYPTLNSNKWSIEEHNKIFNSVEEATKIFKKEYPLINIVKYATKFDEMEDKYLKEHDLAVYKILTSDIVTLTTSIKYIVNEILLDLSHIYLYYEYAIHIGTAVLKEELNVPEELLEPLEPYFYNKNNSSFYGAKAISYLNDHIEVNFKVATMYIGAFNDYNRLIYDPEDFTKETVEVLELFNKAYDSGVKAVELFEELKKEPFKNAIEISVESDKTADSKINDSMIKQGLKPMFNKDYEAIYKSKLASAPKYNFETFELILPTVEVDPTEEGVVN